MENGIKAKLDQVLEQLETQNKDLEKKKVKKFVLPFGVRMQEKKLARKNKILVFLLRTNRTIEVKIALLKDGMLVLGEKYHNGSPDFVFMYKGKIPAVVLPEWDLNPIGTKDYYEAVEGKRIIDAQTIMLRAIEAKEAQMPKKLGGKALIGIGVACVVVFYVLFGGGVG